MVIIINEFKFNEFETTAEEQGMLSEFKEEDYDSGIMAQCHIMSL